MVYMVIKLEVFCLWRDVLSRIAQGIDLYTSAKFRALTLIWTLLHHFPVPKQVLVQTGSNCQSLAFLVLKNYILISAVVLYMEYHDL